MKIKMKNFLDWRWLSVVVLFVGGFSAEQWSGNGAWLHALAMFYGLFLWNRKQAEKVPITD